MLVIAGFALREVKSALSWVRAGTAANPATRMHKG